MTTNKLHEEVKMKRPMYSFQILFAVVTLIALELGLSGMTSFYIKVLAVGGLVCFLITTLINSYLEDRL